MLLKRLLIVDKNYKKILPKHVAIIMDGNGRWATKQGKSRIFGHQAGLRAVRKAISFSLFYKLKVLTLFAFSSENWNRPLLEIMVLMELFFFGLHSEIENFNKHNIRLKVLGDLKKFGSILRRKIFFIEKLTLNNSGLILNIAANYGGKWDIIEAVKKIVYKVKNGFLSFEDINEFSISKCLSMNDCIPIDLVIRTGGEYRLSNFFIWQIAYSELYFTNVLWPDFDRKNFEKAVISFINRKRRFGSIT
ncbi:UDP pyrophosphate synthase [Buchnera aphidicola (Schlechtendalia chinensis)]|uniref:Ditrans,polycis-undecaprenyl-diphosphate synthase ((2E,6E)-farnesyl-diphosphate specific) n=1 Tax=Buchnera aphidicola subsp. Schlechtendalia chinensis TaxID=118110 RepID=A0A172WDJ8_BUCSC|nr:polyprenyl diphosphate synthase [Buchnera aphidicola]ANF17012.1 UDP pyrophosphate synthase [Buchnera aphidicola (Schlechtendalia chinensis)]